MYLKKLEVIGFKSFADKVEFPFPKSVTAIVGPNGCGKSNVVDAFKWIFGEQSAKGLRGEEMKDVIFNGTLARKATGLAEVTVVFDNSDRALDIDYAEVAITRRLFRSGESEYLINKQKCRLRDIKELLLDTGLGTSSYAILEQGKIDVLLQASTLDRRIIFEEAAGISKYRVKKAETLRSLERTTENLSRLGDIADEVEKRMHRLKVQAGKARRFRECSDRLRKLRVEVALEDYRASIGEREQLSCRRAFADHRVSRVEDLAGRLREALERRREGRQNLQEELARAREDLGEVRTKRERTGERIEQDTRRLGELAEEGERKVAERATEAEALQRILGDLDRERAGLARVGGEIVERRALLEEKQKDLEGARLERESISREIEALRAAAVEVLEERSRVGNRLVQVSSELGNLAGRRDRTAAMLAAGRAEAGVQESKERGLEEELAALKTELSELDGKRAALEGAVLERRGDLGRLEEKLAALAAVVQDRRSRLEVLKSIDESREGLGKGLAELLADRERWPVGGEVRGLVADFVEVERRYAAAVEAVLGEHAQALVVETQEGGLVLLAQAQESAGGGIEVIALDRLSASSGEDGAIEAGEGGPTPSGLLEEAGVLGMLIDKVRTPGGPGGPIGRLLQGVILVEDLATGVALSRNGLRPYRLVSLDGSRIEPWGAMSVAGRGAMGGIISRRSEMADLGRELSGLSGELESAKAGRDALSESIGEIEREGRQVAQAREAMALKVGATESLLAQARREREHALREVRVAESELEEIAGQERSLSAEREKAEAEAQALDARRQEDERLLAEREAGFARLEEACRHAAEAVTELKVGLAEAEEREEGLRRSLGQLEEAQKESEKRGQGLEAILTDLKRRHAETTASLEQSRVDLEEIRSSEAALAVKVETIETGDREAADLEGAFAVELERLRKAADEAREERERLNLREQEGKLKRNALVEKIADEYGLDLPGIAEGRVPLPVPSPPVPPEGAVAPSQAEGTPPPSDHPPSVPSPLAGSSPSVPEVWDRQAVEAEIQTLKEKLRHLGNVNLEALDELEELEERHRFMLTQRDDLQKAERDLKEIIGEINRTSRELFLKTFESVQVHFGEIFRKCFGGGMAELVLEEGADVLEAGIEIVARPPGKKLTSLSLMSGGEKTMTTIALLFAIFRSRPSPFCILDEVDAPLDENNVRRFVLILQDFVANTQFIIITHNKITMAEADSLFGITMEERGVSKRVAVEFESYDPEKANLLAPVGRALESDLDEAGDGSIATSDLPSRPPMLPPVMPAGEGEADDGEAFAGSSP